jgi:hypothetical protein
MPYCFVDDGYPEAADYENNYVWIEVRPRGNDVPRAELGDVPVKPPHEAPDHEAPG